MRNIARRLRSHPTPAEQRAWQVLRRLKAEGLHVRRQHVIASYVVDFAILNHRVALELDGGVHAMEFNAAQDGARDAHLSRLGWRVLRLPNKIAFSKDHLLDAIRAVVGNGPSPRGEGWPKAGVG